MRTKHLFTLNLLWAARGHDLTVDVPLIRQDTVDLHSAPDMQNTST
jgi:hypothetical protein